MPSTLIARFSLRRFSDRDPARGLNRRAADRPPELWLPLLRFARRIEVAAHTLHFYGSAGIAAFGWAICEELGWEARAWVPLWFFAGLLTFIFGITAPIFKDIVAYISAVEHMSDFSKGIIDSRPIVWYVTMTALMLFLTYHVFQYRKWKT